MFKVIVIDDDEIMRSLLETLLEMEGYQVGKMLEDENYHQAIIREKPDLALMDVHLLDNIGNQVSGFDILRNIRADDLTKNIYVLMSSGMDFSKQAFTESADGFILKPYMPEELLDQVKQANRLSGTDDPLIENINYQLND